MRTVDSAVIKRLIVIDVDDLSSLSSSSLMEIFRADNIEVEVWLVVPFTCRYSKESKFLKLNTVPYIIFSFNLRTFGILILFHFRTYVPYFFFGIKDLCYNKPYYLLGILNLPIKEPSE